MSATPLLQHIARPPSIRHRFGCTASLLLVALFQVESTAEGVPDALRDAWQRRQDSVKSARFEWQSNCEERHPREQDGAPVSIRLPGVFMLDGNKRLSEKFAEEKRS
ncbi:MAG TPA: hypothetical protein VMP01_11380 [Pirellulaceae bacterium]|nr:hypothetical protein [Pirellulaceae bacterium]